jgi:hypothetical protein
MIQKDVLRDLGDKVTIISRRGSFTIVAKVFVILGQIEGGNEQDTYVAKMTRAHLILQHILNR